MNKIHTMIIIKVTEKQFKTIDTSDLDYNHQELISTTSKVYSGWDYEHGLSRQQKRILALLDKARKAGIDYVLFTKGK